MVLQLQHPVGKECFLTRPATGTAACLTPQAGDEGGLLFARGEHPFWQDSP